MLRRVVKVRLYPTTEQKEIIAQHFGCGRFVYNKGIELNKIQYEETGKGFSKNDLFKLIALLKKEFPWLKDCYSQVLQMSMRNLGDALSDFFKGKARHPRYKSKFKSRQSIQFPENVKLKGRVSIAFPGRIGAVKASIHRSLDGKIKTVTLSKTSSDKYYCSVLMDYEGTEPEKSSTGKVVGIDVGIQDLAISFDGIETKKYENPQYFRKEKRLAIEQRRLSKKKKGSNNRKKQIKKVARVPERVSNARQDHLHKVSRTIVNENQVLVVENLNILGMVCATGTLRERNRKLAKSISDAGLGMFINFISYKLERSGKVLIKIDRWFPSSKLGSSCGYKMDKMPLEVREWQCPECGCNHDRDINAAKNIRAEGIRILSIADGTAVKACGADLRPQPTSVGAGRLH
ncbi:MAG: IS200/IS605 family element transposase accessory protein TnpB [Moorea sp. SIOASIH]|uniref:RNA-guided endonuclease InsQ/TnpB family protein n=1 Tax=Moorena sp. SIOASIH TaxID=2607817 RepID=UPI0013BA5840|nr:RNA-guided endonuclease TnpB family protein [Moorena sp. SIOASIH]NEO38702.1 IS200/IS605 family element transposase accessory protein TnpB [Moorena sp. SIOASIH]